MIHKTQKSFCIFHLLLLCLVLAAGCNPSPASAPLAGSTPDAAAQITPGEWISQDSQEKYRYLIPPVPENSRLNQVFTFPDHRWGLLYYDDTTLTLKLVDDQLNCRDILIYSSQNVNQQAASSPHTLAGTARKVDDRRIAFRNVEEAQFIICDIDNESVISIPAPFATTELMQYALSADLTQVAYVSENKKALYLYSVNTGECWALIEFTDEDQRYLTAPVFLGEDIISYQIYQIKRPDPICIGSARVNGNGEIVSEYPNIALAFLDTMHMNHGANQLIYKEIDAESRLFRYGYLKDEAFYPLEFLKQEEFSDEESRSRCAYFAENKVVYQTGYPASYMLSYVGLKEDESDASSAYRGNIELIPHWSEFSAAITENGERLYLIIGLYTPPGEERQYRIVEIDLS